MKGLILAAIFIALAQTGCTKNSQPPSDNYFNVGVGEFEKLVSSGNGLVLDVRTLNEYQQGHIANAILVDFYKSDFKEKLNQLDKDTPVYMYCRSGNRSGKTMSILKGLGFKTVYNLKSGINEWNASGLPVEK